MKIDSRDTRDIENKIEELARRYTPEWNFERESDDIGSAIAKLFAIQMKENIDHVNAIPDRYHAEFINMLDISLKPVKAAASMVNFQLVEDTIAGTTIRKGTRLLSDSVDDNGNAVLFETDRDIYITNSRVTDMFMTDREEGSIVPLLGRFVPPSITEGYENVPDDEEAEIAAAPPEEEEQPDNAYVYRTVKPFVLFSEQGNISKSILIFYHESIFDITGEPIYIRLSGNEELVGAIEEKRYVFKYYNGSDFVEFDSVRRLNDDVFEVIKSGDCQKVTNGRRAYSIVILEALEKVSELQELTGIGLSSRGRKRPAEFVNDGTTELDRDSFAPFSDTLSVYNECYIGHDLYFSKAGAKVMITFHTEYKQRGLYLTKQEIEAELKIIKKKPKVIPSEVPAASFADEIMLEYYNGTGWKKLRCLTENTAMFANEEAGDNEISFICPSDWVENEAGAFRGRTIRMRLIKADNCYLRPCIHHYPIINKLQVEYSYEDRFVQPGRLMCIAGTQRRDITDKMKKQKSFVAISGGNYSEDALYMGFDRRIEGGPVSIYFELEDIINQNTLKCYFEYSTISGFKRMKIVDHTRDFSRSGTVMFIPASDMQEITLEGKKRFWIRIIRRHIQNENESVLFLPKIRRIMLNVVGVSNIITGPENDFYINESSPNQHFILNARNILDAEVWVNEKGSISREEIDEMVLQRPDDIRVEYNSLGGVTEVFVKWEEADSFLNVKSRRSYCIDRFTNELIFSDGSKADYPKVTDDVAFKVRVRSSNGSYGNVGPGEINDVNGTEIFVDSVMNPVRAYGGSNMETVREALKRGANILSGRNRLVTINDYIFAILNFSDSIDKVVCIPGERVEGGGDYADLSFVLLMKDFNEGSFSFHGVAAELRQFLQQYSSLTISPDRIHIVEPIFVDISVGVWAEIASIEDSFEVSNMIHDILEEFLNPVSHDGDSGWDIGTLPKRTQIMMKLGTLKSHAFIRKTTMVAHYVDKDGEHETDIADIPVSPFMSVRSGRHQVHIEYKKG
ncbi:MAG: hypothetical protein J6O71_03695 [Lachnospiraceae bacterium]|nr:hypothetical protein [Lachnospiraceae bacterium]